MFSNPSLTSPKPTLPPLPAQQAMVLDGQDPPLIGPLLPLEPQWMLGDSPLAMACPPSKVETVGKKYCSNKKRGHAKWKCQRADQQDGHEARCKGNLCRA